MSQTEIFNLALDAAGSREAVSAPNENTRSAEVCNRNYETVVKQVLAAAPWPSATAFSRLSVLVERDPDIAWNSTQPDPGWLFAYSVPIDMIIPRFLSDFSRFVVSLTNEASPHKAIMTNTEEAILCYTRYLTDETLWDVNLRMAIIHGLAARIVMPLEGKPDRMELNYNIANQTILEARVAQQNLGENQYESLPEWITARGFSGAQTTRYYYPFGPTLAMDGVGVK